VPRAVVPGSVPLDPPCGLGPLSDALDRLELVADKSFITAKEVERIRGVCRARVGSVASDDLDLGGAHDCIEGGRTWAPLRDDDPAPKPARRRFTEAYKAGIVAEYERATDRGAKGELLRREGLYTSQIVEWRRALEPASRVSSGSKKRSELQREVDRLRRRPDRLSRA